MNKASRRSGGIALKPPPEGLVAMLELLNVFGEFLASSEMSKLLEAGYADYLIPMGIELMSFFSDSQKDRLIKLLQIYAVDNNIRQKAKWFSEALDSMPEILALDFIKCCPMHRKSAPEEILCAIKEIGFDLFQDTYTAERNQPHPIENFYYCLYRFEEILAVYNILYDLTHPQSFSTEYGDRFFGWYESDESPFVFGIIDPIHSYSLRTRVISGPDKKKKLIMSDWFELLNKIEIERIRVCPQCEIFFWVGRKDVTGCRACTESLRKKRWRDKQNKRS